MGTMSYILGSMTIERPKIRAALAAAVWSVLLSGCTLFRPASHEAPPPPAPPPAPAIPAPVQTERFELSPDQDIVGQVQVTTATKEDTLTDIARRFNVGYEEIVRANPGVDPWLPGAGRKVVLPTQFILPNAPREGVVINIAAMRMFYFPKHKSGEPQVVITHPIGIGKVGWSTPEGVTKIVRRQKDPTWTVPVSVIKEHRENGEELDRVIGPGPDNPLGRHAFYLQWPSYLIHGTNKPAGVGLRSSHGCIRLYPEDIAQLFDMVPIGTQVRVVNQPFVFGWAGDNLFMQPLDVLEDDARDWKKAPKKLLSKSLAATLQKQLKEHNEQVDWDLVSSLSKSPRGVPVAISTSTGGIDQIVATAPLVRNEIPDGSTWDGKTDLPMDEATFHQMLTEIEPGSNGSSPASAAPAGAGAKAPSSTPPESARPTAKVGT
jgi:L,D-transpeptidase ErfK/SrfK